MQKLIDAGNQVITTALVPVAEFIFDDECLVKRIRTSIAITDPNAAAAPYLVKLYVVQGDDILTSTGGNDIYSVLRLVSFKFGQNYVNLDHTITMRKLAGSYVRIYADLGTGSADCKFTTALHYLEV